MRAAALLFCLAVLCLTYPSAACPKAAPGQSQELILLHPPETTFALTAEALVRIGAELKAAGFSVCVVKTRPGIGAEREHVGRIELSASGSGLQILASAASDRLRIQQLVSPPYPDAEVLAIRAVESLRAALLQALRDGTLQPSKASPATRGFASNSSDSGSEAPTASPAPITEDSKAPLLSQPHPAEQGAQPEVEAHLAALPTLVGWGHGQLAAAIEGRGILSYGSASLGALMEGSVYPAKRSTREGNLELRHFSLFVRPGWAFRWGSRWQIHVGAAVGLNQIRFSSEGVSGVQGKQDVHSSFALLGDLSLAHFSKHGLGLLAAVKVGGLLNTPTLIGSGSEIVWGRPLWTAGMGIAWKLPAATTR